MSDNITADLIQQYNDVKAKLEAAKTELTKVGKEAIVAGAKMLFAQYPKLTSFGWTQYTKYFNDGDACFFSANTFDPFINGEECDEVPEEMTRAEHKQVAKAVTKFLKQIDDDTFGNVFGDHVRVTVARDDIKIESFEDHD